MRLRFDPDTFERGLRLHAMTVQTAAEKGRQILNLSAVIQEAIPGGIQQPPEATAVRGALAFTAEGGKECTREQVRMMRILMEHAAATGADGLVNNASMKALVFNMFMATMQLSTRLGGRVNFIRLSKYFAHCLRTEVTDKDPMAGVMASVLFPVLDKCLGLYVRYGTSEARILRRHGEESNKYRTYVAKHQDARNLRMYLRWRGLIQNGGPLAAPSA